jgi:hypothetical protein
MIGIDETEGDYGVVVITAHGYALETLSPLRTGYNVRDFQNRHVGRVKTRFAGLLSAAAKFLWWKPEWDELPGEKFRLITPSYHCIIKQSVAGYSGLAIEQWTADAADPVPGKQHLCPPEPELYLAKVRLEQLVENLHGHRMPPAFNKDIAAIGIGFEALELAILQMLGLSDEPLTYPEKVSKLARVLDEFADQDIDLTPLLHSNIAAQVKRTVIAAYRGDWSVSPYATDLIHSFDERLYGFRKQFAAQPWSDADYVDFVWKTLRGRHSEPGHSCAPAHRSAAARV